MKKAIALLMCGLLSASLLVGCGETQQTANEETVSDTKTFTIGFDAEYPPYGYMGDDGEYTGFDIELAQAVCDIEGWELVKTPIDWDSKDMELNSGSIDCIWSGFTLSEDRKDMYTWSDPYCDNSQVIVVAKSSGITTLADLSGKTVGVQTASAALDVLSDEEQQKDLADTFAGIQQFGDYNSAFTELLAGSLDAVAIDIGVANFQIDSRGEDYMILEEKLNTEKYAIGFKLGEEELRDAVNADIKKLEDDGVVAELAEKYGITDLICVE